MTHEKYNSFKHRIDFYLEENGETDNSKYSLGHPVVDSVKGNKINIEYWNYEIARPTYDILKELYKKPNFTQHRNKNMIIHKLDFILKISFPIGGIQREYATI